MAFALSNLRGMNQIRLLEEKLLLLSINFTSKLQVREKKYQIRPKLRNPTWFTRKTRIQHNDYVTPENKEFLQEIVQDRYINNSTPAPAINTNVEWKPEFRRTGVIARKIGVYPLWLKTGKRILTTLLEVLDNHVIKYYTPEEYDPPRKRPTRIMKKKGCLLLGAEGTDPSYFTKEYCGLFNDAGVIPKKTLARFFISPDAALPAGTLISAMHFTVGNYVDVSGVTIDRGFQGVMKRHGFKGMPASHGVTKTHRRPGNIGGGGEKGRVWPGTKLPGHMGNRHRYTRGLKIWRINTKYNVLWVSGCAIPGATNSICFVHDTLLPLRKPTNPVPFPTYININDETLPENIFDKDVHEFDAPTILYNEQ